MFRALKKNHRRAIQEFYPVDVWDKLVPPYLFLPDKFVILTSLIFDTKAKRYSSTGYEETAPVQIDGKLLLASPGELKPLCTALASFLLSLKLTGNIAYVQISAFENLGVISSNGHFSKVPVTLKS